MIFSLCDWAAQPSAALQFFNREMTYKGRNHNGFPAQKPASPSLRKFLLISCSKKSFGIVAHNSVEMWFSQVFDNKALFGGRQSSLGTSWSKH